MAGTVPAVPTRDSLRTVNRAVNPASLPNRSASSEKFFSRNQPAAAPQSFDQHAAEIRQMVQRYNPQAPSGQNALPSNHSTATAPASSATAGSTAREAVKPGISNRQAPSRNLETYSSSEQFFGSTGVHWELESIWHRADDSRSTSTDNLQQRGPGSGAAGSSTPSRGTYNSGQSVTQQPQRVPDASLISNGLEAIQWTVQCGGSKATIRIGSLELS